jgi:hypothetical protein
MVRGKRRLYSRETVTCIYCEHEQTDPLACMAKIILGERSDRLYQGCARIKCDACDSVFTLYRTVDAEESNSAEVRYYVDFSENKQLDNADTWEAMDLADIDDRQRVLLAEQKRLMNEGRDCCNTVSSALAECQKRYDIDGLTPQAVGLLEESHKAALKGADLRKELETVNARLLELKRALDEKGLKS